MVGIIINEKYKISKDDLKDELSKKHIDTRDFFMSIAEQPCFADIFKKKHTTPISNQLWEKGLYLPSSYDISKKEIVKICSLIKKYS